MNAGGTCIYQSDLQFRFTCSSPGNRRYRITIRYAATDAYPETPLLT
ncbi:MAG: hypothetical protein H7319_06275 [Spirosoma sp.]|nr:hypothetical protein [Spirosoma sp.]